MKEITIAGKQYPIDFTMETIMKFEEITDKSFFGTDEKPEDFRKTTDRIALIYAAVATANENHDLTIAKITGNKSLEDLKAINQAFVIIMPLVTEFFKIPKVMQDDEEPKDGEEKKKN